MDKKTTIITQLKKFKHNLKTKIKIDKIIFFGSRAHGRPKKDSDIDLIIVSKKFNISVSGFPVSFYTKKDGIYIYIVGFLFGEQKNKWFIILLFIGLPFIVFYRILKNDLPAIGEETRPEKK